MGAQEWGRGLVFGTRGTPAPFVIATQRSQLNAVPTPTVAWTRAWGRRVLAFQPWIVRIPVSYLRGALVPAASP